MFGSLLVLARALFKSLLYRIDRACGVVNKMLGILLDLAYGSIDVPTASKEAVTAAITRAQMS